MDNEKEKSVAKAIKTSSTIVCALTSGFFTLVGAGAGLSELGIQPVVTLPLPVWIAWGIVWGAVCGFLGAQFLIKILMKKRNILFGVLLGLLTALLIGAVNGFLTGTIIFGVVLGAVIGPIPGLIFAAVFLRLTAVKKPDEKTAVKIK